MMTSNQYGRAGEVDISRAATLIALAFGGTDDACAEWIRFSGVENLRVMRSERGICGTALRIEMGQFFGGKSVPMLGIAGVTAAPEVRGAGVATDMMRECVREMHNEQWPISALYPSTQPLYRKVGYEQVAHRYVFTVPLGRLGANISRVSGWAVKPLDDRDTPRVEVVYREFAQVWSGMLDRSVYVWKRIRSWRGQDYRGFGAYGPDGQLEGYLFLTQVRKPDTGRFDISLSDIAWTTPDAGRRLLMFLADFTTMGDDVIFQGGAAHPLAALIHHNIYKMQLRDPWMLRITHLERAIAALSYTQSMEVCGRLEIADDVLPQHCGEWTISISKGSGSCVRTVGTEGAARVDIGTLAQIWSGYLSVPQAISMGRIGGNVSEIVKLAPAFAGPTPWMTDFF